MSNLSPELQRLVDAGRVAGQPSEAHKERLYATLQSRLAIAAGTAAVVTETVTQSTTRALVAKTAGGAAAALALVAGGFALMHSLTREPATGATNGAATLPAVASQQPMAEPIAPPQTPIATPPEEAPAPAALQAKAKTASSASRAHDSLPEEVAILSRAQTELHSGRPENALRLLGEHERKFRQGLLAEERTAAKIQALCALGRVTEANAQLGKLSPQSLHENSARQACSSAKKTTPRR